MYWGEFIVKWNNVQKTFEEYKFGTSVQRLIDWIQQFGLVSHKSGELFFGKKKREINKIYKHLGEIGLIMPGQLTSSDGRMAIYTRVENAITDIPEIRNRLIMESIMHTWSQLLTKLEWKNGLIRVDGEKIWEMLPVANENIPEPQTEHALWIGKDWKLLQRAVELYGGVVTTPDMAEKGIIMKWGGNWKPSSLVDAQKIDTNV